MNAHHVSESPTSVYRLKAQLVAEYPQATLLPSLPLFVLALPPTLGPFLP